MEIGPQNSLDRGAADVQTASDFGFADAGAVQFLDFRSMNGRGRRPPCFATDSQRSSEEKAVSGKPVCRR
jgi:hypothetical protein